MPQIILFLVKYDDGLAVSKQNEVEMGVNLPI